MAGRAVLRYSHYCQKDNTCREDYERDRELKPFWTKTFQANIYLVPKSMTGNNRKQLLAWDIRWAPELSSTALQGIMQGIQERMWYQTEKQEKEEKVSVYIFVGKEESKFWDKKRQLERPFGEQENKRTRTRGPLTRNVLKLEGSLKTRSIELVIRPENDSKEFMVGRDDVGLLDATVTSHLAIDSLKVGELQVIRSRLEWTWRYSFNIKLEKLDVNSLIRLSMKEVMTFGISRVKTRPVGRRKRSVWRAIRVEHKSTD